MPPKKQIQSPQAIPVSTPGTSGVIDVGLDIGYGVVKLVTHGLDPILFPSVMGHAREEVKFREDDLSKRYPGDQLADNDGHWYIGRLALSQLLPGALLRLRGRTAEKDALGNAFRVRLAKVALGKAFGDRCKVGDVIHVRLATGLPVDHMRGAKALKESLIGQHVISSDVANFVVNIVEVMVMPQPYGTIYSQMLLVDGKANPCHTATRTGVCDVGTYTVDLALDDDGEFIDVMSGSVESGIATAQEMITAVLDAKHNEKPSFRDVENTLRTGCFRAHGIYEDYSTQVIAALEPLRSAVLNLLSEKWRTAVSIDVIYVSGGGAEVVFEAINSAYPQAVLVKDAQLANARGYLNYAATAKE